jgi:hypothetical protein
MDTTPATFWIGTRKDWMSLNFSYSTQLNVRQVEALSSLPNFISLQMRASGEGGVVTIIQLRCMPQAVDRSLTEALLQIYEQTGILLAPTNPIPRTATASAYTARGGPAFGPLGLSALVDMTSPWRHPLRYLRGLWRFIR